MGRVYAVPFSFGLYDVAVLYLLFTMYHLTSHGVPLYIESTMDFIEQLGRCGLQAMYLRRVDRSKVVRQVLPISA